jgi:HEAT repeat protein
MKLVQACAMSIVLCTVSIALAGGIGIPRKEDVPKYLKQLQTSKSAAVRANAAMMLGERGGINANDVEDAVDPLKSALQKDTDAKVRGAAARALGNIHPDAAGMVPMFIDRLKNDEVADVKMAIVVALGQYGGDAKDALPPLREMYAKFDTKAAKKSANASTIDSAIKLINGGKKKKN